MTMNPPNPTSVTSAGNQQTYRNRNFGSGFLFGLGLITFLDEVVFHQLLQWHHFYDLSTTRIGIISDGLLSSFAWFSGIFAFFMVADLRRKNAFWPRKWIGAVILGAGTFQLFDGLINHKVLNLHQIRYDVDILPYDLVWNIAAVLLILIGVFITSQTRTSKTKKNAGNRHA